MEPNWPLIIATGLILLKQFYKLFLHHVPDKVDYLKAVAALPLDLNFLIVSLFIKAAISTQASREPLLGLLVVYFIISVICTLLWRVSDDAIRTTIGKNFVWACPLNLAMSATAFFLALRCVG